MENLRPSLAVPLRYLTTRLAPSMMASVGLLVYLARKFTANAISGLVQMAMYRRLPTRDANGVVSVSKGLSMVSGAQFVGMGVDAVLALVSCVLSTSLVMKLA